MGRVTQPGTRKRLHHARTPMRCPVEIGRNHPRGSGLRSRNRQIGGINPKIRAPLACPFRAITYHVPGATCVTPALANAQPSRCIAIPVWNPVRHNRHIYYVHKRIAPRIVSTNQHESARAYGKRRIKGKRPQGIPDQPTSPSRLGTPPSPNAPAGSASRTIHKSGKRRCRGTGFGQDGSNWESIARNLAVRRDVQARIVSRSLQRHIAKVKRPRGWGTPVTKRAPQQPAHPHSRYQSHRTPRAPPPPHKSPREQSHAPPKKKGKNPKKRKPPPQSSRHGGLEQLPCRPRNLPGSTLRQVIARNERPSPATGQCGSNVQSGKGHLPNLLRPSLHKAVGHLRHASVRDRPTAWRCIEIANDLVQRINRTAQPCSIVDDIGKLRQYRSPRHAASKGSAPQDIETPQVLMPAFPYPPPF